MPANPTERSNDLCLTLSSRPAGTDDSLRNRGTLTHSLESADDDRSAAAGAHCGLPIG
jgi:hypothetical protein